MVATTLLRKSGVNDIPIASAALTDDLQNALRKRPKGKKKAAQTALPVTKITDKKKILWLVTVTGFLNADSDANYPTASKIIADTIKKEFIKESEKPKEYVPIWA